MYAWVCGYTTAFIHSVCTVCVCEKEFSIWWFLFCFFLSVCCSGLQDVLYLIVVNMMSDMYFVDLLFQNVKLNHRLMHFDKERIPVE